MYAHQVIEDLSARLKDSGDPGYLQAMSQFITKLRKAQHFHIGEIEKFTTDNHGTRGIVPIDPDSGLWLAERNLEDIHMPYPLCWIDCIEVVRKDGYDRLLNSVKSQQVKEVLLNIPEYAKVDYEGLSKSGILVEEVDKDTIECEFVFYQPVRKLWQFATYKALIRINGIFEEDGVPGQEVLLMYHSRYDHLEDSLKYALKGNILVTLDHLLSFLKVLSCKNVSTDIINPSAPLNKKRRKTGKQELFNYHVLSLTIPGKKKSGSSDGEPTSHNRVHFCRAHWKEYTSESPLMGKYVGRYLWQSHLRGQNKEGLVVKDYNIKIRGKV